MKVGWYHKWLRYLITNQWLCRRVDGPNMFSTCDSRNSCEWNGEKGVGASLFRLYKNTKGTQLCSCCAVHYPNSMLSQSRWKKVKDVEERPPKVVDLRKEEVERERSCRANMTRVAENKKYARILKTKLRRKNQMYCIYYRGDRTEYKGYIERINTTTGQVNVRCCSGKRS